MPVIGITGGIATGKSSFCAKLREAAPGAVFFDADRAARELVDLDPEVRSLLTQTFGGGIHDASGNLNRAALRAIVFADPERKRALEQILHPRIRRQWAAEAETRRQSNEFFFADIPLLYETGGESLCDAVVVVACSPELQVQRLMERSSLSVGDARTMIAAQMPLSEKIARADHVVWNNGTPGALGEQARLLVALWSMRKKT